MSILKKCNDCGEEKPLDQFHKKKYKCKPCQNEYTKQYKNRK